MAWRDALDEFYTLPLDDHPWWLDLGSDGFAVLYVQGAEPEAKTVKVVPCADIRNPW